MNNSCIPLSKAILLWLKVTQGTWGCRMRLNACRYDILMYYIQYPWRKLGRKSHRNSLKTHTKKVFWKHRKKYIYLRITSKFLFIFSIPLSLNILIEIQLSQRLFLLSNSPNYLSKKLTFSLSNLSLPSFLEYLFLSPVSNLLSNINLYSFPTNFIPPSVA